MTSIKTIVKRLVPPILLDLVINNIPNARNIPLKYPTFSSYEDAKSLTKGYEDEDLARVVVAKVKIFSKEIFSKKDLDFLSLKNLMSLRTFIALASSLDKKRLKVV